MRDEQGARFSQRLNELIAASGKSAAAVARDLGISKQALSTWRTGIRTPKPPTLKTLARYFRVSVDWLTGDGAAQADADAIELAGAFPVGPQKRVPIIGTVRAGYNGVAYEEFEGVDFADVGSPEDYFYLRVTGDSMAPQINAGELALVRKQDDVESGEIAVVVIGGDEGTIKKVLKRDRNLVLQPFNPDYPARVFIGREMNEVRIVGKVVETKRKW